MVGRSHGSVCLETIRSPSCESSRSSDGAHFLGTDLAASREGR